MSVDTNNRIGIAGLSAEHHARWAAGLATYREIGEELGVKTQTVHKAFQHRGWTRSNAPPIEPPKPAQPSKPDERLTEPERERMSAIAHKRILMGAMILADKATAGLQAGGSNHSASSLNAYGRVLRQAAELLTGLLYPTQSEEGDGLTELRVRVLTDDEHAALKLKGERGDEDEFDDLNENDLDDLDEDDSEADTGPGTSAGACVSPPSPGPGTSPTSRNPDTFVSAPTEPAPAPRLGWALPPLPDPEDFRSWLEQLGASHGRRYVREIAIAVSGRELGAGTDLDHLAEIIQYTTGGNPGVMKNMLDRAVATG